MDNVDLKEGPINRILQLLHGLRKLRHQHAILQELTLSDSGDVGSCTLLEEVTLESRRARTQPYTKDWEMGQLYSGIRVLQREGLDASFREERRVSIMLWK